MTAVAFIAGLGAPKFSDFGDFDMVLAQNVIEDNIEYLNFLKDRYQSRYVILDNGEFEGMRVPVDELIERAKTIGAHEIVAPDMLHNKDATIKLTNDFIGHLTKKEKKIYKIQAVPQGTSIQQWSDCYDEFVENPDIDVIGLSREAIRVCFRKGYETRDNWKGFKQSLMEARIRCIQHIHSKGNKPLHLLGMTEPAELRYYDFHYSNIRIRSVDTLVPYVYGLKKVPFLLDGSRPIAADIRVNPNQKPVDIKQKYIIVHNILVFLKVIRGQVRW